jgi:hypothetical protein
MDYQRRYYFDYNGKRCYAGQKIKINHSDSLCGYPYKDVVEARFNFCSVNVVTGEVLYCYQLPYGPGRGVTEKIFFDKILIEILDKADDAYAKSVKEALDRAKRGTTFKDEMNIDGLPQAWVLYILAMLVSIVLNDRLTAWALATVMFTYYRNKKLKEVGRK